MHPGLLADILEHPDDDTPRLILADWLDEQGQEARAEFIRVQVELAKREHTRMAGDDASVWHRETRALRRREQELWGKPSCWNLVPREWMSWLSINLGNLGATRDRLTPLGVVRRGFMEEIILPCAAWLDHGTELVRCQPLRQVRLMDRCPERGREGVWWRWFRDWSDRHPSLPSWTDHPYLVPDCWWPAVVEVVSPDRLTRSDGVLCDTEQQANDFLSMAAIAWAKQQEPASCG